MKFKFTTLVIAAIASLSLVGCAAFNANSQARKQRPPYASPLAPQGWVVTCPAGQSTSTYNDFDVFYDDNGLLKTQERFCEESPTGSRIRKTQ